MHQLNAFCCQMWILGSSSNGGTSRRSSFKCHTALTESFQADRDPRETSIMSQEAPMDIDAFKREAEALARPATILRDSGAGDPVAYWHGTEPDSPCISIRHEAGWLNVLLDTSHRGGRAELGSEPIKSATPLFAYPSVCMPPVDAVFMLGSQAIGDFLAEHDWPRDEPFNTNFPSSVPEEYEIYWQQSYPLYQSDVDAVLGGWHMF